MRFRSPHAFFCLHATDLVPGNWRRHLRRFYSLGLALGVLHFAPQPATAADTAENTAKHVALESANPETVVAAYLINFLRYVEWPETIPPAGEPWRIGLLNADNYRGLLERLAKDKIKQGRPIVIVSTADPATLRTCQIVLLGGTASANAASVAKTFDGRPVLTVVYRNKELFASGAMIELVMEGRNIRYRLNVALLKAQGLMPTPGLLENALPRTPPPMAMAQL